MAIQLDVATRNAMLNAIETTNSTTCAMRIYSGTPPADCSSANSGTLLADFNLPDDWLADASSGSKAKAGTWQEASADGAGTAGHFRIYNNRTTKDGTTCFMQGTCTGGGDMTLDNYVIAATQVITITSFTLTAGNA